ncbi:flagellar protein FliO/FliZ [Salirhabdus euzebyi]|uniref:Flagellar protein FliO/FliZ n=1 Tax=Salirhabdus euzebyi TaxID=394506 RepID=A0A841Q3F9_9BACI|nr:flagellar biosynthetic protein FliO [Salirhabdus euzebyi]MBB6452912.1 flagellar protein FliO/FliZ [Salirhabdus euzebyi]
MTKHLLKLINIALISLIVITPIHTHANVNNMFDKGKNNTDIQTPEVEQDQEETPQNGESNVVKDDGSLMLDLVKMFFMLILVLGLIYLLLKFLQKRNKMFQQVQTLENLGGISLGANKSMQMVRIGNKVYVVGVGDDINLLTEITDEELLEDLLTKENTDQGNPSIQSFVKQFQGLYRKDKQETEHKTFKQLFNKELHSMKNERKKIIESYRNRKEDQDG